MTRSSQLFISAVTVCVASSALGAALPSVRGLTDEESAALRSRIQLSRSKEPQVFEQLLTLKKDLPGIDARKRGRYPLLGRLLRSLGPQSVDALLNELAFDSVRPANVSDDAWDAWVVGILNALEQHQSTSALPVLKSIIEHEQSPLVYRAALSAYAAYATDDVAFELAQVIERPKRFRRETWAAVSSCHRLVIVNALRRQLAQVEAIADQEVLVEAIARVANEMALQLASSTSYGSESGAVRVEAADALISAFLRQPRLRGVHSALREINAPETTALLKREEARAQGEARVALEELRLRWETRRHRG